MRGDEIEQDQRRRHLGLTPTAMQVRIFMDHVEECEACLWPAFMETVLSPDPLCRWGRDLRKQFEKGES